jgi:uncharacterized protein (TIGR01777 family)
MKILLTGGTGFLGSHLSDFLIKQNHELTIISRSPGKFRKYESDNRHYIAWQSDLSNVISEADAIINLAGKNLFDQRWTSEVKREIRDSRINVTRAIIEGVKKAQNKPKILLSASAVGYYGERGDEKITEETPAGDDFLATLCKDWESEALKAEKSGVRVVISRIGIPLAKDGGALQQMLTPFRYFVGGALGNGQQYFPWIHFEDLCRGFHYVLTNDDFKGAFNVCSPNPVTMNQFARALVTAMNRPSLFSVPGFALKLALGDAANSVTASLRVLPKKLLDHGFRFKYKKVLPALIDIVD